MDMEQDLQIGVGGAGAGYYGGTTSDYADACEAGAGGSSFISRYEGCNAIDENSTENNIIHTEKNIHYSGRFFSSCVVLDGNSEDIIKKNLENGYAVITYLSSKYKSAIELNKLI